MACEGIVSGTDLARKILCNLTYGGNKNVRKDYVEHLTSKSIAFLKRYETGLFGLRADTDILRDATFRMVDRIYTLLEPYVVQYNKAVGSYQFSEEEAGESNDRFLLSIATTPPDETLEKTDGE